MRGAGQNAFTHAKLQKTTQKSPRHGPQNHGVGSPDHFQESDISMLYYLSVAVFRTLCVQRYKLSMKIGHGEYFF